MEEIIEEKYLPIGTVALLKGGTKRVMITGFCSMPKENPNQMFDYSGCMYPEGSISTEQVCLFNHDQIKEISYMGLKDEEEEQFKIKLKDLVKSLNGQQPFQTNTLDKQETQSETLEI